VSLGGKQTPVLPACSSKFDEACKHITATERKDIARIVLQLECLSTPRNGSWSSMWHVYAIASVLKKPIFSVYPKTNERTRPAFHKNVSPRLEALSQRSDVVPVVIMWTHTHNKVCSTTWTPNHFVPCYAITTSQTKSTQSLILPTLVQPTYSVASSSKEATLLTSKSTVLAPSPSANIYQSSYDNVTAQKSMNVSERIQEVFRLQSTASVTLSSSRCASVVPANSESSFPSLDVTAEQLAVTGSSSFKLTSVEKTCLPSISVPSLTHYTQPIPSICTTELAQVLSTHSQNKRDRISSASTLPLAQYFPKKAKVDTEVLKQSESPTSMSASISIMPLSSSSETTPTFTAMYAPTPCETFIMQETTANSQSSSLPNNHPVADDMNQTIVELTKQSPADTILTPSLVSVPSLAQTKSQCTELTISTATLAHILTTPRRKKRKQSLSCQVLAKFFHKSVTQAPKSTLLDSCSSTETLTSNIQTSIIPLKPDCSPVLPKTSNNSHFTEITEPLSVQCFKDSTKTPLVTSRVKEIPLPSVLTPLSTNCQAHYTETSEFTAGLSTSLSRASSEDMDMNVSSMSVCNSTTQGFKSISPISENLISDSVQNSTRLPAHDPKIPQTQTKSLTLPSSSLYQVSKASTDTSKLSTNLVKLTDTPDSNTIAPSMIFNILSSSGHDNHKNQVQSKKITDFVNSPALITSASNDSDDSLNEFSYFHDEEQESGNSLSSSRSSISDESDIEIQFYPKYCSSLPFPQVSADWYEKQYSLSIHNAAREEHRHTNILCLDERNNMQFINRSLVNGTLENNISSLILKIEQLSDGPRRSHLQAIVAVGKFIVLHGTRVNTQDADQCYMKERKVSR